MVDHMREASDLLRQAEDITRGLPRMGASPDQRAEAARLRLALADRHVQLAAIEKGLQPPSVVLHAPDGI